MAITTVSGTGKRNNGGTVVNAGATTGVTKTINVNTLGVRKPYGSRPTLDTAVGPFGFVDPHGVIAAKSGGTGGFAYFPKKQLDERNFIMLGAGDSASKVNNDVYSGLNVISADRGADGDSQIRKKVNHSQTGSYATKQFNLYATPNSGVFPGFVSTSGTFVTGAGAGTKYNFASTSGSYPVTDVAASPSRAVPGDLVYMYGGKRALVTTYKAKSVYES